MVDDWLIRRDILTMRNAELKEINAILDLIYRAEWKSSQIQTPYKTKTRLWLGIRWRCWIHLAMEDSQDHSLSFKKGFIMMHLPNLDPKSRNMNGTRYDLENIKKIDLFLLVEYEMCTGAKLTLLRISGCLATTIFIYCGSSVCSFQVACALALTTAKAHGQCFGEILETDLRED